MNTDTLQEIESLTRKAGLVFIATADEEGSPHVTSAETVHFISEREISITGWFCPTTEHNIARNPKVAVVIWDRESDHGYQVIGRRVREEEIAIMDGYSPGLEEETTYLQVESELILRIDTILEFHHAQHNDDERVMI